MSVKKRLSTFLCFSFISSLPYLFSVSSLLPSPISSTGRWGEGSSQTMNKRKGREWKKKKSREKLIFISFTHYSILLCFPFFSIFLLHSYLLRFLASLSLIFPRYFGTLYIVFFPFHSLNLFFLHSESLGFLLSLSHFHYNSSERFSANPKAFLLKKRD